MTLHINDRFRHRSVDRFDDRHRLAAGAAGGLDHLEVEPAPAAFASDKDDPLPGGPTHYCFFHDDAGWQFFHDDAGGSRALE